MSNTSYHSLNNEQKDSLLVDRGLCRDTMELCANAGHSIRDSIEIAEIMQSLNIELQDAATMIAAFENAGVARREVAEFRHMQLNYLRLDNNFSSGLIQFIVKGYTAKEVIYSAIAADVMGLIHEDIIHKESSTINDADI